MKKLSFLCMALAAVIMVGCAAPEKKEAYRVFYPEPPELPRIQFLASFTGSKDIEPPKSAFDIFLTGKETGSILQKPYGVAVYDGKIYVCDTMKGMLVFDFQKKTFGPMQGVHGPGNLIQPLNISIDKDGNKYIADPARGQVLMFDKDDFYVKAFGTPSIWRPVDAAVFEDKLYVVDVKNAEIDVFDRETGDLVKKFGQKGEPKDILVLPTNIAFDPEGYLYVSDSGRFQIVKFDRDGHERATIGELGAEATKFARPKGVAVDRNGNLYAADAAFDSIQVFNKDNRLLLFFGKGGTGPGDLELPAKVAINYDSVKYFTNYADPGFEVEYIIAVTSQIGDHMVNVYGFGKEKGKKYPTDEEVAKQLQEKYDALKKEQEEKKKAEEEEKKKAEEEKSPDIK